MNKFKFTTENLEKIQKAIAKYPEGRAQSAIKEILYLAQDQNGWISNEVMEEVAKVLSIPVTKVKEVATFYSMFFKEEVGKFVFQVCTTTPCMLRGAYTILDAIKTELNIDVGQTTTDGMFTITEVECLGACSNAPMLQINNSNYYEDLTVEAAINLIKQIKAEGREPKAKSFIGRNSAEPLKLFNKN